jgi:sialic acid synthase SpsE
MILIAEISNCHFGSIQKAKEMIVAAHDSGATLVKLQAFKPEDVKTGSMPLDFYKEVAFSMEQYISLIEFGKEKGVEVFYSVFSESLNELNFIQGRKKFSGAQTAKAIDNGEFIDYPRAFVSFPKTHLMHAATLQNATPLYVSEYLVSDPELFRLEYLEKITSRFCYGYSDHTVGNTACEIAIKRYGAKVIEKHFTLEKDMKWKGHTYRDSVFGATAKELNKLAKIMRL